jgi:L-2,4-diaminobutyrate decarboxylase
MSLLDDLESDMTPQAAALFTDLVVRYFDETRTGEGPVSTGRTAAELARRFEEPMPRGGRPLAEVVDRLATEVLPDCNRLWHPRYVGHQVSAPLPAAVWTEALVGALNQSLAVWEMSPVATVLEARVVRWCCDLVGFGAEAGGTLTTGGTEATLAALLAARSAAIPDVWSEGVGANPPVVVCGEHAHYAVTRAAGQLGLGMRSIVSVPSRDWRMDVAELERALERLVADGRRVMAVVATAGSTATGSFDDLEAIGEICERRGIWLHVDAAHGGSALLSAEHRGRLAGIGRARSIAWDPHKMMLLPLQAGLVLVRQERDLENAFAQHAPYLFHDRGGERVVDQGVRSFLCSRRADVLKLWVALQRYGADGIGALYDQLCASTRTFHMMLEAHPDFEPLHEPESNILCFRWVGGRAEGAGARAVAELDEANRLLRERFNRSGAGWITTTVLGGRRVLRVTIMNPRTGADDLRAILDALAVTAAAM